MSVLEIVATLLALSALFGYINHKFLKLPHTIGMVVIALVASFVVLTAEAIFPGMRAGEVARSTLEAVDFRNVLLNGFLSAMLFAGAVHVDLSELIRGRWAIGLLATVGVVISTLVVGSLIWAVAPLFGVELPFAWALVFGALISPTDPIAVLAIMRRVRVPASLHAKISGESLLNDGVGVVVFTLLLAVAGAGGGHGPEEIGVSSVTALFVAEAFGGLALGLFTGLIAFTLMRTLDEHNIEVMITLALVAGTYALALRLEVSGPLAVVVAGVLIGNHGARFAMSENTREHVFQFWDLVDEILNSLLFLLIGLEVLELTRIQSSFGIALAAIPIVLAARALSVAVPIGLLKFKETFDRGTVRVLTWGGLRGGISVALALSLPSIAEKPVILAMTYAVVVFSILVQGLTVERLVRSIYPDSGDMVPMPLPRA